MSETSDPRNDIFRDLPDDERPVTRREMRQIVRDVRSDLRWAAALVVVGGQALSHIEVPTIAGIMGGAAVIGISLVKLAVARG